MTLKIEDLTLTKHSIVHFHWMNCLKRFNISTLQKNSDMITRRREVVEVLFQQIIQRSLLLLT